MPHWQLREREWMRFPFCIRVLSGWMSSSVQTSRAARLYLGVIGGFLMVLGLSFTWWLWQAGERAMITRHWTETPCLVLTSGIREEQFSENSPVTWRPELEYRYAFGGEVYHGTKVRRVEGASPHKEKSEETASRFPAGLETTCWVNPAHPEEAVLEHSTSAAFYTLWWPLLFAVGGAGMLWPAVRGTAAKRKTGLRTGKGQ